MCESSARYADPDGTISSPTGILGCRKLTNEVIIGLPTMIKLRTQPEFYGIVAKLNFESDIKYSIACMSGKWDILLKRNEILRKEVDHKLAAGMITTSESSWTSPIFTVAKKDGSSRFFVHKKLNLVMHADRCILRRVGETLYDMRISSIFKTIDLFQGHRHIKMA